MTAINYQRKELPSIMLKTGVLLFLLGLIIALLGYAIDHERAAFNGVILLMFVMSVGLGSLFLIGLEYLVGADWSVSFRRIMEILAIVVFAVPVFSLPLFANLHTLFHWTHIEDVLKDPILKNKMPYLNEMFFSIRSTVAFVLMFIFWWLLAGRSFGQDSSPREDFRKVTVRISALFMPIFAIVLTIMAVDWLMSLEPHWFSTIFGVYYFAGTFSVALAVVTLFAIYLNENSYLGEGIGGDHYYNFGALLFAFTNFWAYIAFSQFLLIWYANLPEETFWYLHRWEGSWAVVSIGIIIIHFIVPYAVLLPQPAKSDPKRLKFIAWWLVFAHFYDLYWLVMPTYSSGGAVFGWMEIYPVLISLGTILILFYYFAKNKNLLPIGDPKLPKSINFHL